MITVSLVTIPLPSQMIRIIFLWSEFSHIYLVSFWLLFRYATCGILVPRPGIEPAPLQRKLEVLTTGLPGKSPSEELWRSSLLAFVKYSMIIIDYIHHEVHYTPLNCLFYKLIHFDVCTQYAGGGNGNPLQYSCLKNPRDCSLPGSSVHGTAKSRIQLSNWALNTFLHKLHWIEKVHWMQWCLRRAENPSLKLSARKTYPPLLRKRFPSWPMQPSEGNPLSQEHVKSFQKLYLRVLWLIPNTLACNPI